MSRAHGQAVPKRATTGPAGESNRAESRLGLPLVVGVAVLVQGLSPQPPSDLQLAYLDPGSGSFLIQALVALVAGVAVALRTYWEKVRSFLGFSRNDSSGAEIDAPGSDD